MKPRQQSNEYWAKRAEEQLTYIEQLATPHLNKVFYVYDESQRRTINEIRKLYADYYTKNGFDLTELNKIAPNGDMLKFIEKVNALQIQLPAEYSGRLTRLQLLGAQQWLEGQQVGIRQLSFQTAAHIQTIETAYQYAIYNITMGTGVAPTFGTLDKRTINKVLTAKFAGSNYSNRIWKNTGNLAKNLTGILGTAISTGQSPQKTVKEIRQRYNVGRYEAARLVRTETSHFNTMASSESYKSAGLEQFVYVATLDGRTSAICAELDGKRFSLGDTEHQPPQHPNCRSCIRSYLGDKYEPDMRIMRDAAGNNQYIPQMTYAEWKELY